MGNKSKPNRNKRARLKQLRLIAESMRDKLKRRKWLTLIDREDLLQREELKRSSHLVCSAHFGDSSFKTIKRLKEGAVPSQHLHNQPQEDSSCSEAQSTSARVESKKCVEQEPQEGASSTASAAQAQAPVAQTSTQTEEHPQHPDDAELKSGDDLSEDEALVTFRGLQQVPAAGLQQVPAAGLQQVPAASTSAGGAGNDPHDDAGSCGSCHGTITGIRYVCVQCEYSHCAACEAAGRHDHHYMLRVPRQHLQGVVQRIVKMIQMELSDVVSYEKPPDPNDEQPIIKTEIKPEVPDPLAEDTPRTEQLRPDILEEAMLEIVVKEEFDSDKFVDPPPPLQMSTTASLHVPCPAPPPGGTSTSKRRSSASTSKRKSSLEPQTSAAKKSFITIHGGKISGVTVKTEPLTKEVSLQTHEEASGSGEAGVTKYDANPSSKQKSRGHKKEGRAPKKKVKQ